MDNTEKLENKDEKNKESEYEDICYICHRPESKAGKMIKIPNEICICQDCMQKTFDSMNHMGFPIGDMSSFGNMPNISMINLSDLQNMGMNMMPKSQKLKKKKAKEEKKDRKSTRLNSSHETRKARAGCKGHPSPPPDQGQLR